ncbi:MAG: T9SS type A sorting domain-containing protein [Bacteroidota bacterium]
MNPVALHGRVAWAFGLLFLLTMPVLAQEDSSSFYDVGTLQEDTFLPQRAMPASAEGPLVGLPDATALVHHVLQERWTDGQWVNHVRTTQRYDPQSHHTESVVEHWRRGAWLPSHRATRWHDAQGRLTARRFDGWSFDLSEVVVDDGPLEEYLARHWHELGSFRINSWDSLRWDEHGHLTENVFWAYEEQDQESAWVAHQRILPQRDEQGRLTHTLFQWPADDAWVTTGTETYRYGPDGTLQSSQNLGFWATDTLRSRRTHRYGPAGHLVESLLEEQRHARWRHVARNAYAYDVRGRLREVTTHLWIENTWTPTTRATYAYEPRTESLEADAASSFLKLSGYPNPFSSSATVAFTLPEAGQTTIDVFDVTGRRVRRLVAQRLEAGPHEVRWETRGLASGVYFVRLVTADHQVNTHTMTLVR